MPTYKEQQILDNVCKVMRQKQIKYYDFIPFFDFQYEKNYFQLSALPLFTLLGGPWSLLTRHVTNVVRVIKAKDLKGNEICFEVSRDLSYRGFELLGVKLQ